MGNLQLGQIFRPSAQLQSQTGDPVQSCQGLDPDCCVSLAHPLAWASCPGPPGKHLTRISHVPSGGGPRTLAFDSLSTKLNQYPTTPSSTPSLKLATVTICADTIFHTPSQRGSQKIPESDPTRPWDRIIGSIVDHLVIRDKEARSCRPGNVQKLRDKPIMVCMVNICCRF